MSSIEKILNDELEQLTPQMSERLKNHPINAKVKPQFNFRFRIAMPIFALLVLMLIILPFALNPSRKTGYVYVLEVNPTIIISTDAKRKVTSVKSGNQDADQVLIGIDEKLIGKDLKTVSEIIADELLQLGYFEAEDVNAFKITSDDKNEITAYFTDYFASKGYMSIGLFEAFDLTTFNEKFASDLNDIKEIHQYIKELNVYYFTKEMQNFKELYESQYLTDYLKGLIEKEIAYLTKLYDVVSEIKENYYAILACDELPFLYRDYFLALDYIADNPEAMTEGIEALFNKMAESLEQYHELTGDYLEDTGELLEATNAITSTPLAILSEYIDNLVSYFQDSNKEKIDELFTVLASLFPNLKEHFTTIKDLPESLEDFVNKVKIICQAVNTEMKKAYKEIYNTHKEAIDAARYAEKVNEIIKNYGNLENFYNSCQ